MKTPDHPRTREACVSCRECRPGFFCELPDSALAELEAIRSPRVLQRGSNLFVGVYLLCSGRIKLSTYSEDGKAIILRVAEKGELLGLGTVISGEPHEKTAHASEDCVVGFIQRTQFVDFLEAHPQAALNALRQMSSNYHKAHIQICSLGLSSSVGDKLARLLLQWCEGRTVNNGSIQIPRVYTHGDIAEMIGTSRETVTRLLSAFKDRGLIVLSRTELCIPDREHLRSAIGSRHLSGTNRM
jgi:CRP/FNR family transcriptional regulator, cyclic AMP receptor protein